MTRIEQSAEWTRDAHVAASRHEQVLTVDGRDVVLTLSPLAPEDRERVAATIAHIVVLAATDPEMNRNAWRTFVDDVLSKHVAFAVDGEPDMHRIDWWDAVLQHTAIVFVKLNSLDPAIRRHVNVFLSTRPSALGRSPS